jgi:hypothetical protein
MGGRGLQEEEPTGDDPGDNNYGRRGEGRLAAATRGAPGAVAAPGGRGTASARRGELLKQVAGGR